MKFILILAIAVILIIGLAVGAKYYSNYQGNNPVEQPTDWKSALTDEEKAIFNTPGASESATEETRSLYGELINKLAKTGDEISITTNCRPEPLVLAAAKQSNIKFSNNDENGHIIELGPDKVYSISPGSTVSVSMEGFDSGLILGYNCDQTIVGFIKIS